MASLEGRGNASGAGDSAALISISTTTTALALLTCVIRFMLRSKRGQSLLWDDHSVISAMLLGLIGASFAIVEGSSSKWSISQAKKFNFLAQPWLLASSTLATVSICLFFIQTLGGRLRACVWILSSLVGCMAVVNFVYILLYHLQCRPLRVIWEGHAEGSCLDPAFELNVGYLAGSIESFAFVFLAIFPSMLGRDVDTVRIVRWPVVMLSMSAIVAGILSIIKMCERSGLSDGIKYSSSSGTITILGVLIQNMTIMAANILPTSQLLTRQSGHLALGSSSDTELNDRISTDSSSIMKVKRSATLTKRPSIRNRPSDRHMRKPSVQAHKASFSSQFGATEVEAIKKPADVLMASTGIMKTTTIHVVEVREEDSEEGERTPIRGHTKAKTSTSDGWKDVLSGSPS